MGCADDGWGYYYSVEESDKLTRLEMTSDKSNRRPYRIISASGAGIAQVFKDLKYPFPLIRKPQVGGSIHWILTGPVKRR